MEYIILGNELRAMKDAFNLKERNKINFVLGSIEENIKQLAKDKDSRDSYRDIEKITENIVSGYAALKKQYLNNKNEKEEYSQEYGNIVNFNTLLDKKEVIYIPIEMGDIDKMAGKESNILLEGTSGKFVAETQPFNHINDLIILEVNEYDVPVFSANEEFVDILSRLVIPPYKIDIDKVDLVRANKFMQRKRAEENKDHKENHKVNSKSKNSLDIDRYINKADDEELEKSQSHSISSENVDRHRFFVKAKIKKLPNDIYDIDKVYDENTLIDDEALEKKKKKILDEGIVVSHHYKVLDRLLKLKDKKLSELKYYNKSVKRNSGDDIREKKNFVKAELEEIESDINIETAKIKKFKEKYNKYIKERLDKESVKMEIQKIAEDLNIESSDVVKYTDLEKVLRVNVNTAKEIVEDVKTLIKQQKRFAKIGAETHSGYSSLIDGFAIKAEAEKLKDKLEKIYEDFEEYYFNKINKKSVDEKYEAKLGRIMESSNKVAIFLNYLNNPKTAKKRTKINRFDELVLLEENELKRIICKTTENIIAKANLDIVDDEISRIEFTQPLKKFFNIITGKQKLENYRAIKLDEMGEKISEKLNQKYTINKNYKIHDIIAEIMLFKVENMDDKLVKDYITKLENIEKGIAKNFIIDEEQIIKRINKMKTTNLPINLDKMSKTDEIDLEMNIIANKYGYNDIQKDDGVKYEDTCANEIKQILDYIKLSY